MFPIPLKIFSYQNFDLEKYDQSLSSGSTKTGRQYKLFIWMMDEGSLGHFRKAQI